MRAPLISIVIPVYNVERYLQKCVESVINQTYKNIEIILVDDGATDLSGRMCDVFEKKDSRVVVIHKRNGGLSDARNAGTEIAQGDYIAYIDSDDYVDTKYIEKLYEVISDEKCDFSMCSYLKFIEEGNINANEETSCVQYFNQDEAQRLILSRKIPIYAHGKLFDKKLMTLLCFPKGRLYEDVPTVWKILKHVEKVGYVEEPLYYYRQRADSIVNEKYKHGRMDQLYFAEEIYRSIKDSTTLKNIAGSRCFFSAMDNYTVVTPEYKEDRDYLYKAIKRYYWCVMQDGYANKSLKLMAIISIISPKIARIIGKQYKLFNLKRLK